MLDLSQLWALTRPTSWRERDSAMMCLIFVDALLACIMSFWMLLI